MENLQGKVIAVTGATGFLGRYLVDVLRQRGAHVIGVVRNPDRVPDLQREGVEMRRADLGDVQALQAGFAGADAVVSNAALFSIDKMVSFQPAVWREHEETNVRGAENVMRACHGAGVTRVVQVSSVAGYRSSTPKQADEDYPQLQANSRRLPWNAYQISKAVSEQATWRLAGELGLALTVVRPCGIYGAFDPNATAKLRAFLDRAVSVWPIGLRFPLVHGGDVAEGVARALERPVSVGKAYHLTGDDLSFAEVIRAWGEAGGPLPRWWIPLPVPVRSSFRHDRARTDLGWSNRSLLEGFRDTFERESRPA